MAKTDLREAMSTLRAVRRLKPDAVPDEVLRRVLEAASWAPTGGNTQPWRVVVVRDRDKMKELGLLYSKGWYAYAEGHRAMIADAPEAIRASTEKMFSAGNYLADNFSETPVLLVFCFNPKIMAITDAKLDRISVVGGASIYTAVQNTLLACRGEGLGCVLTTLLCECEEKVRGILEIPEPWGTAAAIPIGYPVLGGHGPITRRPVEKLAFEDTWGIAYSGSD
jgi:nitroreductase